MQNTAAPQQAPMKTAQTLMSLGRKTLKDPGGRRVKTTHLTMTSDMVSAPPAVIKVSSQASPEHEGGMDKSELMCNESSGTWEAVEPDWFSESPAVSTAPQHSDTNKIDLTKTSLHSATETEPISELGLVETASPTVNEESMPQSEIVITRPTPVPVSTSTVDNSTEDKTDKTLKSLYPGKVPKVKFFMHRWISELSADTVVLQPLIEWA